MSTIIMLFHPLTSFQWDRCGRVRNRGLRPAAECIVLEDKLYIALQPRKRYLFKGELYVADISTSKRLTSNTVLETPSVCFSLAVFHSQLVLVGGEIHEQRVRKKTNKVWVTNADGDINLHPSLPPMLTERSSPSALSAGTPECLIVAGGRGVGGSDLDTVEVLVGGKWCYVAEHLPRKCCRMRCTLHNSNWVLMGGRSSETTVAIYCNLSSLLASVTVSAPQSDADGTTTAASSKIFQECELPWNNASPFVIDGNLAIFQCSDDHELTFNPCTIRVYSPFSLSWVQIDEKFSELSLSVVRTLPSGEVVVVGDEMEYEFGYDYGVMIFKGTVKVLPYSPDRKLSMSTFFKLEAAGFPVVTTLGQHFMEKVQPNQSSTIGNPEEHFCTCISMLQSALSKELPTWGALLDLLRSLDYVELSQQIEQYLICRTKSLKELCMSVITSALLQQWSLEPDQLCDRLPHYVPTVLKQAITRRFKAHTNYPTNCTTQIE